ncbi:hypothetical protein LIER_09083 [Lithospermum erythrorhizon]|uniref:Uncharacterized protein n=1 Tax=Lithospermum erythrorhizon TaxID=34254 RepID=A0AAV3PEF8_LITER
MSGFIRDHEHEAHKDANYMALYREERNVCDKGNETVNAVENDVENDVDKDVENEDFMMEDDSEDSVDYSEGSGSESESDGSGDDDLHSEDVLYGKDIDGFDDGELPGSQPTLSVAFLENIEEEFVIPDLDGHADNEYDAPIQNSDCDVPSSAAAATKKKGPQISTFEKSIFDGTFTEGQASRNKKKRYRGPYARHGTKFKQRRMSGWVQTDKDSDCEQDEDEEDDNSDLNSDKRYRVHCMTSYQMWDTETVFSIYTETSRAAPSTQCAPSQATPSEAAPSQPPPTPVTGEEEVIDPKQVAHEKYLHDLYEWMNDIRNMVPLLSAVPQTPMQPTKPHSQQPPETSPARPTIVPQLPPKPRKQMSLPRRSTRSSTQTVASTDNVLKKMTKERKGKICVISFMLVGNSFEHLSQV